MTGCVVAGKHLGTKLGFPTANVKLDKGEIAPDVNGVYLAKMAFGGTTRYAIVNQGDHPTFPEGEKTIEAHILDYEGDIYGSRVEMEYLEFLRPERKFATAKELTDQIASDEARARRIIAEY